MTTAPPRTSVVTGCRDCAGRSVETVTIISVSNHNAGRIGQHIADQHGAGAHTHFSADGDCIVVRPLRSSAWAD
ncbi:hypothetical protein [Streptomyces chryseus]|uniref:hypothetical protein n=1 Tax=Streptomyces chryseus TaxID=68186 RepID=UPI00110FC3D4|nr:hypothetical protein [Streptomyces chryseus]GGX18078.1 hypothetical protein GCM10010353_36540 [Streptomyces chryseus]